ncbi:TonB-dependent receptor [Pontibacter sp. 172403-2]|uniref:SusC/RagA family TonB-linked outer membrane protein n=1 Tax=Pontibacter rufus TaxID=2791028 RepID=UPI0018B006AE|nr:TonB-dependent receptor [Pontibacter sp. 172403-2]MBF9255710.1 TonB-dependent receptor [Pontibacter sp. 172403-2]
MLSVTPLVGFSAGPGTPAFSRNAIAAAVGNKQDAPVSGVVRDASGQPLPGVSVSLKGTSTGTITDVDGRFTIDVSGVPQPVLVFSYIGFKDQEVTIGDQNTFNISLQEDVKLMDEVVVVGYGTQKKANLTGAVSQVTSEVLEDRPVTNVTSGLQGTMPGVTITNASGVPGNNSGDIRIRGLGTWGDAQPLVVIDGITSTVSNLNILNPSDIATVSVLKDAASSSIYGVRGANGVIVVTTKKGSTGKPAISYDGYFGIQTPTALPEFLGSPEYMQLLNEAQRNVGLNPTYSDEQIEIARNGSDPNYYANTDWMDAIYKDYAPQQSHNLSVSGGAENISYYLSYGYLKEGGLITGDNYQARRHNVRAKLSTTFLDRLDVSANLGYIDRGYTGSAEGVGSGSGPLYAATQIVPLVPVRFTTGGWGYLGGQRNPVAVTTDGGTDDFASQEFTANLNASIELFDGFRLRGQYGLIRSNSMRTIFSKTINYYSPIDGSIIYKTNFPNKIDRRDYTNMFQTMLVAAEYEKTFADKHDVKALLAASREEEIGDNFAATRTDVPTQVGTGNLALGTENQLNSASANQWALQSLFGRVNYGFDNRYLFEANFRYDGSSKFAPDLRWQLFGAASVGWVFTEESFLEGIRDVVEFGKLRYSYGTQGNDRVENYAFLNVLEPVETMPIGYINTIGYRQAGVPNEFLTWETQLKQNLGLDLVFLRGRLGVTADYFKNETSDLLLRLALPGVLGGDPPYQNVGKLENRGWELQFDWRDDIGDFTYGANFNISDVRNELTELAGTDYLGDRIRREGDPLDAFYGLVADRLAQENDFSYDPEQGQFVPDFPYIHNDPMAQPGDIIYKDLNGDGEITLDDDRQVLGSHIPRYTYGFRGTAGWKGIDFSFFLQGVGKANGYLFGAARHALISEGSLPQPIHLDRWTPENTDATYPRLTYQQTYNQRLSTYWLEDASYLRLKNIQIGYTLPSQLTEKFRVDRLRIYASADNLLTKTDFFYAYDPETPVSNGGYYPQVKTFVLGLNINLK